MSGRTIPPMGLGLHGRDDRIEGPAARRPLDVRRFGDPLAEATEWTPIEGGGSNFGTHRLRVATFHRCEFRPTAGALAFYLAFALTGLATFVGGWIALFAGGADRLLVFLFLLLFGVAFGGVGGGMLYTGMHPIVFDVQLGYFWKGRRSPPYALGAQPKEAAALSSLHALQIVSERCSINTRSRFTSYELNLVLNDGSRRNVVDHGNLPALRDDACELARFLIVPVWDATE